MTTGRAPDTRILKLFGCATHASQRVNWATLVRRQACPFTDAKCFKVRKSQPEVSIGTCSVRYGRSEADLIICPNRLLERKQVFTDCLHLLTLHEPGNELHVVPEVSMPGGSVDYFLVSAKRGKVRRRFNFAHVGDARLGDAMHIHAYRFQQDERGFHIELDERISTDAAGVAACLGIQAETRIELETIVAELERKLSPGTLLTLDSKPSPPARELPSE